MNVFDSNSFPIPTSITVETLTPNSQYRLGVNTVMGSYRSEISWIDVMTTDIQFFETAPAFNDDIWIDSDSFSLSWQPLENADSYSILLESLIYSNSIESVCGFEDIEQPWETSSRKFNKALFGSSSPSLQLDNDGDWMSFSTDEGKINGISFWVRSQSSSNSFRVETLDPQTEEWKVFIEETPGSGEKSFHTIFLSPQL